MKIAVRIVAAAAMLAVTAGAAQAQTTVTGTATGCFTVTAGGACIGGGTGLSSTTSNGLMYTGSTFSDQTSPNYRDGRDGVGFGSLLVGSQNFGTFTSFIPGSGTTNYSGMYFTLFLNLTSPGVGSNSFASTLFGSVTSTGGGGVSVDFDNTLKTVDGASIAVADVNVNPGLSAPVTGYVLTQNSPVQPNAVPEPASMVLLGTGLVGLFGVARRKQKQG